MADVQKLFREYVRLDRKRRSDALSPREFARWRELSRHLSATFSPAERPVDQERRESVRVPVRLRVHFHSAGELRRRLLTNLSRGGMFVSDADPPPIGTKLVLRIVVEDEGTEIELAGEVVSHNVGPAFDTQSNGMGIRFVDPSPAAEKLLQRLYEGALDQHGNRG
jgi:uncharacterized protein (TIGR02266 family)